MIKDPHMDIGQPMATWPKKGPERPKIAMRWTIHMLSLVRAKTEKKINHKKRMKKEFISRHTGFEILEVFLEPFMICILTVQKIYNSTTSNRSSLKSTRRPLKSRHVRKALKACADRKMCNTIASSRSPKWLMITKRSWVDVEDWSLTRMGPNSNIDSIMVDPRFPK